jgi:hypothetical protein
MNQLKVNEHQTIVALHDKGWSKRKIARELGLDRVTVRKYIAAAKSPAPQTGSEIDGDSKSPTLHTGFESNAEAKSPGVQSVGRQLGNSHYWLTRGAADGGNQRHNPLGELQWENLLDLGCNASARAILSY